MAAWAAALIAIVASAISALQARSAQRQVTEARRQADAAERAAIYGEQQLQLIRDQLNDDRLERREREQVQRLDAVDALLRTHWELFLHATTLCNELRERVDRDATREVYVLARHAAETAELRLGHFEVAHEFRRAVEQIRQDREAIDGALSSVFLATREDDRFYTLNYLEDLLRASNEHMFALSKAASARLQPPRSAQ